MKKALVGYTGFVGSNLNSQHKFDDFYNSLNINELKNKEYDLIIFAGVPSVKWLANKEPEKDLTIIDNLIDILKTVKTKKFILISTIDVYPLTSKLNEDYDCSSLDNHAYGSNRLKFENFCSLNFSGSMIVRLPGLFGDGIKKNVIYDLLNDNCLDMINIDSSFQYYFLDNLWSDIEKAYNEKIKVINLFTEPITTKEIIDNFFQEKINEVGKNKVRKGNYNLFTKYSSLWNRKENYISTKQDVLKDLEIFIERYENKK